MYAAALLALFAASADDPGLKEDAAFVKIQIEYEAVVGKLLGIVSESKAYDGTHGAGDRLARAVNLLGVLRVKEAASPLLDIIDYEYAYEGSTRPQERIPIAALIQIGKPASIEAVKRLATDTSETRRKMFVRVIAGVEGLEIGKEMVRRAAEKDTSKANKRRLTDALDLFKTK